MALKPQQRAFLAFLGTQRAGNEVSRPEILSATGWAGSTFDTYISKNHLARFLMARSGRYLVLLDGSEVTEDQIHEAFTQVKPAPFTLFKGWELSGQHGSYRLLTRLGNGAVGHVWRCSVVGSDEYVAAKIACPREDLLKELDNVLRRFAREAKNPHSLAHPNIVVYRDYGQIDGHPFLVMNLGKRSVASMLDSGPLSVADSLGIVENCLQGLNYLHGLKHVHRDIKPANIIDFEDRFVLADLGIVRWSDMNPEFVSAGTITRNSMQLGSWPYMAPEQRETPHEVPPAADIYALGATWYELLAGAKKIPDPARIATGKFSPATTNSDVAQTIRRMLDYEPEQRPSITELLQLVRGLRG